MFLIRLLRVRYLTFLQPIIGILSFLFMCANVFFWTLLVHLIAPLLLIRNSKAEALSERCFNRIYLGWVETNEWWFRRVLGVKWELDETLKPDFTGWSIIIANHRSWVDVFVIFAQLKGRRPLPRVFMKQALFWMPFVGTAALIMGFPFMKRYSKEQLKKNPKLVGKDLETTKRSCRRLMKTPNSIMSFAEGTRFSLEKHKLQNSPYGYLLKPKAGGIAYILQTMSNKMRTITDINVLYYSQQVSGWDLLCGRLISAKIIVREVALPDKILAPEYQAAGKDRESFFAWFNLYWNDKDVRMGRQLESFILNKKNLDKTFIKGKTSQE